MRNFISKEDMPILFASTYECANFVRFIIHHKFKVTDQSLSDKKKTLIGYKEQCYKV